jgi:hypothetical protein
VAPLQNCSGSPRAGRDWRSLANSALGGTAPPRERRCLLHLRVYSSAATHTTDGAPRPCTPGTCTVLPGSKCVTLVVPRFSWGADGTWGIRHCAQARRIRKFGGKTDQHVKMRLFDPCCIVPLLREASDILTRVTCLDLDSCLLAPDSADCPSGLAAALSASCEQPPATSCKHMAARNNQHDQAANVLDLRVSGPGSTLCKGLVLSLLYASRSLACLRLSNNKLSSCADVRALGGALLPLLAGQGSSTAGLTSLDLSYNGLGPQGAQELGLVLQGALRGGRGGGSGGPALALHTLNLRGNNIGASVCGVACLWRVRGLRVSDSGACAVPCAWAAWFVEAQACVCVRVCVRVCVHGGVDRRAGGAVAAAFTGGDVRPDQARPPRQPTCRRCLACLPACSLSSARAVRYAAACRLEGPADR